MRTGVWMTGMLVFVMLCGVVCGEDESAAQILIAAEKSEFKDAVVEKITKDAEEKELSAKVIELKQLPDESVDAYEAVVIVNTVWAWRLRGDAKKFLKDLTEEQRGKVILVSTAADESWETKQEGVHAITSASKMNNVDKVSGFVVEKLAEMLEKEAEAEAEGEGVEVE